MLLKYLTVLLVLNVLFKPLMCTDMDKTINNCFSAKFPTGKPTTSTAETCPNFQKVIRCIYTKVAKDENLIKLTPTTRGVHEAKVQEVYDKYFNSDRNPTPSAILKACEFDPQMIVPALKPNGEPWGNGQQQDENNAGTRNQGTVVVGAILMAAAVAIVI